MRTRDASARASGFSSCLLELHRLVRGVGFYAAEDPERARLLSRTHSAWLTELTRAGSIGMCVERGGFEVDGCDGLLDEPHSAQLAETMARQGIAGLFLNPEIERDAIEGLAMLLANYAVDENNLDPVQAFEPWEGLGITVLPTLGSSLGQSQVLGAPDEPFEGFSEPEPEAKTIEEDPIGAAGDPAGGALCARLRILETSRDVNAYTDHAADAIDLANELFDANSPLEAYRAVLLLTQHATLGADEDRGSIAHDALRELCEGPALAFVIDRCCSMETSAGVRAAQVLLQVGEPAVGPILERLRGVRDPDRLAQLAAVVIALGDQSVEPLRHEISALSGPQVRMAVQLAGELQNPKLVPSLVVCLHNEDASLRKDAAKALVTIGNAAHGAFVEALSSNEHDIAKMAVHCLGVLGHRRAVRPLLDALERALKRKDDSLAREAMRALGDIGDPRAIPTLEQLATTGSWLRRGARVETKLAAVSALENIEGVAAEKSLRELGRGNDARVAERASQVLARRSPVDSAGPA